VSAWKMDELEHIAGVDEVQVASRRTDGSLRPFVTIWAVRHGDDIYVRSAHGPENGWFVRAVASGAGRLHAGRAERDITFERPDASSTPAWTGPITRSTTVMARTPLGRRAGGCPDHASARAEIGARASTDRPRSPRCSSRHRGKHRRVVCLDACCGSGAIFALVGITAASVD
jgi:hypothetical protein